jgi:predicted small metal-binding protein
MLGRRKEFEMDKELRCQDLGMNCDFVVCAHTEEDLLQKAGEHARNVHQIQGFSKEIYDKVRGAIHEVERCQWSGPELVGPSDELII